MKKVLIKILAVLMVVGGLVTVFWPVANWRLYDALWQPLAMTDAEAWCAGNVFGETLNNEPSPEAMEACIAAHPDLDNVRPHTGGIVKTGCEGFAVPTGYDVGLCVAAFEGYSLWWLAIGGYTFNWNDSHPRPQVIKTDIVNAPSRNGDRAADEREGLIRP